MMRSLYSGVSGLKVHQTKMDVIGNNIANVNTVGFKASNVVFSDVFYQKLQSATGPNGETGAAGQNAMQVGLGANLASIKSTITKTGGAQRTDEALDLMINGSSFFVVKSGGTNYFTKAGAFDIDASGTLANANGATVMGWQVDKEDPTKIIQGEVSELKVMAPENMYAQPEATTEAYITGNIDKMDTQVAPTGTGKTITMSFYDELGYSYKAIMNVKQTAPTGTNTAVETNKYTVSLADIMDDDGNSIFKVKNTDGTYGKSGIEKVSFAGSELTATVNATTGVVTFGTTNAAALTFNGATGEFESITGTGTTTDNKKISLHVGTTTAAGGNTAANPFKAVNIDFSSVTMYASSGSTPLEATRGSLDKQGAGKKLGVMTGVNVDGAGKIYGKYDNGDTRLLGQIAVAEFANPAGLESVGNSMFAQTQNSGEFDGVGKDITSTGGDFSAGVLEMSNVDLAAQFTEMITTQRGFQANSRIITTSDSLLEELINIKR